MIRLECHFFAVHGRLPERFSIPDVSLKVAGYSGSESITVSLAIFTASTHSFAGSYIESDLAGKFHANSVRC